MNRIFLCCFFLWALGLGTFVYASPGEISTVAGGGAGEDGAGVQAGLRNPIGVFSDLWGNVYIADTGNHRVHKLFTSGRNTNKIFITVKIF